MLISLDDLPAGDCLAPNPKRIDLSLSRMRASVALNDGWLIDPLLRESSVTYARSHDGYLGTREPYSVGRAVGEKYEFPAKLLWHVVSRLERRDYTFELTIPGWERYAPPAPAAFEGRSDPLATLFRTCSAEFGGLI